MLKIVGVLGALLLTAFPTLADQAPQQPWEELLSKMREEGRHQSFEQYLEKSVVTRSETERFLQGSGWAVFDSELGYILGNSVMPWGIDHSSTIETVQASGARTSLLYADRKARINAYGDSFTESAQVSDGETWQAYLAGHLGEPIRNFGVGGFGVYQAYRRMIREEETDHGAEYLILTICCDDSTRSLYRARWAAIYPWFRREAERLHLFHANFWSNVEMDLSTGKFVEKEQLLSTKESLYQMTEPKWMAQHLKEDLALQLTAYSAGLIRELDRKQISKLAAKLDFPFDWTLDSQDATVPSRNADFGALTPMQTQAAALLSRYSQRATIFILDKARQFARQRGKRLLVTLVVNTSGSALEKTGARDNQEVVDYLKKENFDYFDIDQAFVDDYRKSETRLTYDDYFKKYMVNGAGHLNPLGNHFFAYSLKDKLVGVLNPKPVPYQQQEEQQINFKGYLRGGDYH
jgi:hypothetical protein